MHAWAAMHYDAVLSSRMHGHSLKLYATVMGIQPMDSLSQCSVKVITHLGSKRVSPPVETWWGAVDGVREPASIAVGARACVRGEKGRSSFSRRVMMTSASIKLLLNLLVR